MCIIIDSNVAAEFASTPMHEDAAPVFQLIMSGKLNVAIGGKVTEELAQTQIRKLIRELDRSGIAKSYNSDEIKEEEVAVEGLAICSSNDIHIIALARLSGARRLYTRDVLLHKDFKNKNLIDKPRGKIYCSKEHANLLSRCPRCK